MLTENVLIRNIIFLFKFLNVIILSKINVDDQVEYVSEFYALTQESC